MGVRRLGVTAASFVAVACGVYTIVYLYRWEWHRALLAALLFVAAEVLLATVVLLRRVAALERRLEESGRPAPVPAPEVLARIHEAAPGRRPMFAWLEVDRFLVFLPILLGAGVLASAAAWVVESLAQVTAQPVLERRLAARLAPLNLPAGGLLAAEPDASHVPRRVLAARIGRGGALALALVAGALGIDALADATESRPDVLRPGVTTVTELQLQGELAEAHPKKVAGDLWNTCVAALRGNLPNPSVTDLGGGRWRFVLPADIGRHGRQRLHGCLEDAALTRVQAGVVTLRPVPSVPGERGEVTG